jgi:hypothetical protein
VERNKSGELEGQSSINELLDEPIGDSPTQLALPILVQIQPVNFAACPDPRCAKSSLRTRRGMEHPGAGHSPPPALGSAAAVHGWGQFGLSTA